MRRNIHATVDQTETMKISPNRIFKCEKDKRFMKRDQVWKDHNGKYHCPMCGELVEDRTNTETGQTLLNVYLI